MTYEWLKVLKINSYLEEILSYLEHVIFGHMTCSTALESNMSPPSSMQMQLLSGVLYAPDTEAESHI
jgi:hypothetical protein